LYKQIKGGEKQRRTGGGRTNDACGHGGKTFTRKKSPGHRQSFGPVAGKWSLHWDNKKLGGKTNKWGENRRAPKGVKASQNGGGGCNNPGKQKNEIPLPRGKEGKNVWMLNRCGRTIKRQLGKEGGWGEETAPGGGASGTHP